MASKKELAESIEGMCAVLSLELSTEGMNHVRLTELESDMKAKIKDASAYTGADEDEKKKYIVVQGKALTTKRGVRAGGDEVLPSYVNGGKEVLDKLVKSGHLVKA